MVHMVVSDTHIGDDRGDRNLPSLFKVVEKYAVPDSHLILNGDIFDLAAKMRLDERHKEFMDVARRHGRITYIQGNHDWIIKCFGDVLSNDMRFANELKMESGGTKFRIIHGHQYDFVANRMPKANRAVIKINHWVRRFTTVDLQLILRTTKMGKRLLEKQEKRLARREKWADVIVAGHTHRPKAERIGDKTYVNTGDWVERDNRAFLLIEDDGSFELHRLDR